MTSTETTLLLALTCWPLAFLAVGMLVDQTLNIRQEWSR